MGVMVWWASMTQWELGTVVWWNHGMDTENYDSAGSMTLWELGHCGNHGEVGIANYSMV